MVMTLRLACFRLVFWFSAVWAMASAVAAISVMPAVICRDPEARLPAIPTTCWTMAWMFSTNWLKCRETRATSSVPSTASRAVRSPSPSEMSRMRPWMVSEGLDQGVRCSLRTGIVCLIFATCLL